MILKSLRGYTHRSTDSKAKRYRDTAYTEHPDTVTSETKIDSQPATYTHIGRAPTAGGDEMREGNEKRRSFCISLIAPFPSLNMQIRTDESLGKIRKLWNIKNQLFLHVISCSFL